MSITMFLLFLLPQDIVDSNFRLFLPLSPDGIVGEKSVTHKQAPAGSRDFFKIPIPGISKI